MMSFLRKRFENGTGALFEALHAEVEAMHRTCAASPRSMWGGGRRARSAQIRQVVMSCRVIGLDVEAAILREALGEIAKAGHAQATGLFRDTSRNDPCAGLFRNHGFVEEDGLWRRKLP